MHHRDVPTSEGRNLEVLTGGDPAGFPWLFHTGTPSAAVEAPLFEAFARYAGLRLITYSRPGYGRSTPQLLAAPQVVDDVADALTVLDALGVGEFITLGWSGGGPRALACAALLPHRCRAAGTLAGAGPNDADDLDFTDGMATENIEEFAAAERGATEYGAFLEKQLPELRDITAERVVESLGGLVTAVDAAALTGDYAAWLAAALRHAVAQGVVGWREDGLALVRPWGFDLASIKVPVSVWQGDQDAMVPFAHGEWLAENVPGARPHLLEGEGHLSLNIRLDEILSDLKKSAGLGH